MIRMEIWVSWMDAVWEVGIQPLASFDDAVLLE